ncbi:MAG TPA: helix-turn-helix transcriptional regulator [Pseudonocardia sp.]|nr:helix-turn-helix transcriptional regulator [Pseudonocardia sp.]
MTGRPQAHDRAAPSAPGAAPGELAPAHPPRPAPARPGGPDGTEAGEGPGPGDRAIRVVVVGVPGPEVDGVLAALGRDRSVEVVGVVEREAHDVAAGRPDVAAGQPDVAVVGLSGDGPRPAAGRSVTCPNRASRPRRPGGAEVPGGRWDCSPREREVLAMLAEGATNLEIAARLSISEATVRSHVQNLRGKLRARSRVELVVRAFEMGLGPFRCTH